jgi:hypothetical protein
MPFWWRSAHFTQGEAADIAGLRESTLRDWLASGATMFVSERRRGRRWLSAEDILVLRIAAELVRGGFVTVLALAIAKRHVDGALWFPSDALLAAKPGSSTETGVRLCGAGTIPDWDSIQIIKFGRIAHDILQQCETQF